MSQTVIPLDGRLTSLQVLNLTLNGSEIMEIVSPGNAQFGNNYQVTTQVLAAFFAAFTVLNTETITAGATVGSPYAVQITDTQVLFDKIATSPSFAVLPLSASMAYPFPILFKDIRGDAAANNITLSFSGGETCDLQTTIVIDSSFGWVRIAPNPSGTGWFQC